jgi:predicted outer membrane repeat protein
VGTELHLSSLTICNFKREVKVGFDGKNSQNGAALRFDAGAKLYIEGDLTIASNTIKGGGGSFDSAGGDCAGICLNGGDFIASGVTLNFIGNKSENASGAAIYFNSNSSYNGANTLKFSSNTVLFKDNESGDEGAALWAWDNSSMEIIDSTITFVGNVAGTDQNPNNNTNGRSDYVKGIGGAISVKKRTADITFKGTTQVEFISNTARAGGAIFGAGTIMFSCSSVTFRDNIASTGGAICVSVSAANQLQAQQELGGLLTLDSSKGDIIFIGNKASSAQLGHDIYFERGEVNINGSSGKVVISSGIAGLNEGRKNKSGNGLFL